MTDIKTNPFFSASPLFLQLPPFDRIEIGHYLPAFERGMAEQMTEITEISQSSDQATFDNTLVAMESSGQSLDRVSRVFFSMTSADTSDELEALRSKLAPLLSAHSDAILLNRPLFIRIESVHQNRNQLDNDPESKRLVEETYKDFVRAGALLSDEEKVTLKAMNAELAILQTTFSQHVLSEVNSGAVMIEDRERLSGLSEDEIAAAAEAAGARGLDGKYVLVLRNTTVQPCLAHLHDRGLREIIHMKSISRGSSGGAFDNRSILTRIAAIRAERASLLGFENHAAYKLTDQMAHTTVAVNERLKTLATPAVANARREATDLQALIKKEGNEFELAAWDWAYYAEKLRKERYAFDATELRPYLEMHNVLVNGVFFAAEKLYGLTFKLRPDLPVYHPDVRIWEVFDHDNSTLALFVEDFYARESKRGGAWMSSYVSQSELLESRPVVANHMNVSKPPAGLPTLLNWTEVITMYHEFGHALHAMFSKVVYPTFSGTSVPRDFVEFPSQVNEMWADWPEVLENYAVHVESGDPIPEQLLKKIRDSATFNQGFLTTEYLAASLLDQAWHQCTPDQLPDVEDVLKFEKGALEKAGVSIPCVPPRYRSTYFSHIIGGYAASYYAYIWSEVLDADTVEWFCERGGLLRSNGDHFRNLVLSRGGSEDPEQLYRRFRGADPAIEPLLKRRGLN